MNNKDLKIHIKRLIDNITDLALDALVPGEESEDKDGDVRTTDAKPTTEKVQSSTEDTKD